MRPEEQFLHILCILVDVPTCSSDSQASLLCGNRRGRNFSGSRPIFCLCTHGVQDWTTPVKGRRDSGPDLSRENVDGAKMEGAHLVNMCKLLGLVWGEVRGKQALSSALPTQYSASRACGRARCRRHRHSQATVKYGEVLGRVTVPVRFATGGPTITYNELVETIRQKFKLPVTSEILVTYADNESDVVTMTNDQDLHDALVLQGLNPLRLSVATAPAVSHDRPQITNGEHMMNGAAKVSVSEVVVESQLKAYSSQPDSSPDRPGMSTLVAKDAVQHLGIRCDMCTMCPIIGTRYKSKKQRDYDLCMSCFQDYGSEDDYMKIERPRIRPPTERPAVSMYYTVALNS